MVFLQVWFKALVVGQTPYIRLTIQTGTIATVTGAAAHTAAAVGSEFDVRVKMLAAIV